ncbi:MAG: hypothetical protein MJZ35_08945 [Bacteroidaceae bacterium]|nr:hypothetical protein [Bacteroidaceae bacterium]
MNTTRLINFGKYDLATNKVFYRNMMIMALCIGAGVSAIGFLGRYLTWKSAAYVGGGEILQVLGYASYTNSTVTNGFMAAAIGLMATIFAGCTLHALKTKQGRINELTLPASNSEKYLWHVGLSVGGGLLLALASLLAADVINYILHLATYGNDGTFSLTKRVWDIYTISMPDLNIRIEEGPRAGESVEEFELFCSYVTWLKTLIFSTVIMQICAYIYGNSVKYKYNIILTYLALTVIGIATMIAIGTTVHHFQDTLNDMGIDETHRFVLNCMRGGCLLLLSIGGLLIWRSYKRYCNAQITSRLNK